MARKKLEEAREVQEKETMYVQWEYGVSIDSMIDELTETRDEALEKGALPDSISVEMETHCGYYDDRYHEWVLRYTRMETQIEIEKRMRKTLKQRETVRENRAKAKLEKEEAERKEYERLSKKYGDA
jgi:hypothetical protein